MVATWRGIGGFFKLAVALAAIFALLTTACGGDDDSSSPAAGAFSDDGASAADDGGGRDATGAVSEPAAEPALEPPADRGIAEGEVVEPQEAPAEEPGAGGNAGSSDTSSQLDPSSLGRKIIFVASLEVTVDDVPLASSQAKTAIAGLGGLLFGEDTQTGDNNRTILEFKVLPADFQEALSRLEGLGELESQQISADDVTERVVDLQSRIATAEVSVNRLRDLLVGATDLEAIAGLEGQLVERETNLETLRGQLRTIQDQVDLATIFLTLRETAPPALIALAEFEVTFYVGSDEGARCPGLETLEVDEGVEATICVQLTNVGNVPLDEIELRDDRLGLRERDFTFIDNGDATPLAPDETITAWATLEAPASGSSLIRPTAVAIDEDGDPLRIGVEFSLIADYALRFIEDDSLPGFTDALGGSWDTFKTLVSVVVLVAGALVFFIWVPFAIWGLRVWWVRRQRRFHEQEQQRRRDDVDAGAEAAADAPADPPTPPPSVNAPVG